MAVVQASAPLSYKVIYEMTKALGYDLGNRYESIVLLKDLEVLERKSCLPTLLGRDLHGLLAAKRQVFFEIIHCLQYMAWKPTNPTKNNFSWSYRKVCDFLWEASSTIVNRQQLVSEVSELAMSYFNTNRVSFGPNSIDGILHWFRMLNPSVITTASDSSSQSVFTRRSFCPPETFIMAMDFLYSVEGADYQTNLLLDPSKQETVCKVCLLEPTAFDAVLDWAAGQYDFLQRGAGGGWGNYILLNRQPKVRDFIG